MKKEEINKYIKDRLKTINQSFRKAIDHFEVEDVREFRSEIKKLKVFLHLVSMESEDGLSYRITKRMRTIYGYLGTIQHLQLQLKATSEYVKRASKHVPVFYVNILERELKDWKKLSKDFIDPDYDFLNDEKEIIAAFPDKLRKKSITRFIHYTLYELQAMSVHQDEEALDDVRKFMEDIYFNLAFFEPFVAGQQSSFFDKKELEECLRLLNNFQDKCTNVVLLETSGIDALDEHEKELIKQMEHDWLHEKKEMKKELAARLEAMNTKANNLNEFSINE